LKTYFLQKDKLIGFPASVPDVYENNPNNATNFGNFICGSPLSYQLQVFDESFEILTNVSSIDESLNENEIIIHFPNLPYLFSKENIIAKHNLSESQKHKLHSLYITEESAIKFEKETISQSECDLWFQLREKRITSSICHSYLLYYLFVKEIMKILHKIYYIQSHKVSYQKEQKKY